MEQVLASILSTGIRSEVRVGQLIYRTNCPLRLLSRNDVLVADGVVFTI